MACCFDGAVAVWADDVSECDKKLNQDGGGIGFRVRLNRSNDFTGQAMQGRWVEYRPAIRRCDISALSDKRVISRFFAVDGDVQEGRDVGSDNTLKAISFGPGGRYLLSADSLVKSITLHHYPPARIPLRETCRELRGTTQLTCRFRAGAPSLPQAPP